ncbi:hypothetical protein ACOSP7_020271 [Xanthoceras sorbifolium]|uniref:Neprosin PEP catalytic domain-containing protein n=1 Tax=Xanthoceras sorbifolium TaxID=99658 RepID=A0ABQ8HM42_9ROSI|nr:hypothetical protein JRO89_XS09G0201900 [Xanthoceras sorbifolium]
MDSNFQSDGYKNTGCYNIQCLGFVQIDRSFAFGGDVKPVSIYNESLSEIQFVIKKDKESGNWWLALVDKILGYWPGALFPATEMGSGHFSREGYGKASYFQDIGYYNGIRNFTVEGNLIPYATKSSCYDVQIAEDNKGFDGTHFYNGGPGFSIDCL